MSKYFTAQFSPKSHKAFICLKTVYTRSSASWRVVFILSWIWSINRMTPTGENPSMRKNKSSPSHNLSTTNTTRGTRWRSWLRHCAANGKVAGSITDVVIGVFIDIILPVALWHWVRQAFNRNEYPELPPGGGGRWKAAGVEGWQLYHHHVLIVLKSGSLTFLEPSGPVQVCSGMAFYKYHVEWSGIELGSLCGRPSTNRLSHKTALEVQILPK